MVTNSILHGSRKADRGRPRSSQCTFLLSFSAGIKKKYLFEMYSLCPPTHWKNTEKKVKIENQVYRTAVSQDLLTLEETAGASGWLYILQGSGCKESNVSKSVSDREKIRNLMWLDRMCNDICVNTQDGFYVWKTPPLASKLLILRINKYFM